MTPNAFARGRLAAALLLGFAATAAHADEERIAMVKSATGSVTIQRGAQQIPATVGMGLLQSDRIVTGADGATGVTFEDNALMSLGPNSQLAIDTFRFDKTTHDGDFETTLSKGKMAVVSGKIAKHHLDAMKVRTPTSVLGIRGTEFVVDAGE